MASPGTGPPRYKIAILTWVAISPLIVGVIYLLRPLIGRLPLPIQIPIVAALVVPLMIWVIMPLLTRAFRGWLFPRAE